MVPNLLNKEIEEKEPMVIINDVLIKALNDVGDAYDKGKMYLPQLIASAEAAKEAFSIISLKFPSSGDVKGTVVMCTVKGDVHDIGKNICKVVMESYGYKVIDLGKDTPIEVVVDAYQKYNPDVIGLSALMTTTVVSMEETIKALRKINCKAKIVVGGAVLTEDIAKRIGADYYSKDALDLVNTLDRIIKK
jgi:5-methyltetrahydrofolate--homocysteine methyltransferase